MTAPARPPLRGRPRPVARRSSRALVVLACLLVAPLACAGVRLRPDGVPPPPAGGLAENLEAHVRFLASDALRGRDTGTEESLLAAEYIAAVLEAAGCEPAGEDGGWYQTLDLVGLDLSRPAAFILSGGDVAPFTGAHGEDFMLMSGVEGVRGARILRMTDPEVVPSADDDTDEPVAILLDLGDLRTAFRFAGDHRDELAAAADIVLFAGRDSPGEALAVPEHLVGRPGAPASVMVRGPVLERVRSGELDRVTLDLTGGATLPARNVVGVLRGVGTEERPELADEMIVFTAHYDHVGTSPDETAEDRVFNGANDDASGVATVLELARMFGTGDRPARTLVFLLVTAEEQGLLGSKGFVADPTIDLDRVVCNLNIEMVGEQDEGAGGFGKLFVTGFERSNLGPAFAEAGLPFVADPYPPLQLFFRSDNLPFVERGIPGHSLSSGGAATHYHKVTDEADTLDYAHLTEATEACFEAAALVATGALDPAWAEGGRP